METFANDFMLWGVGGGGKVHVMANVSKQFSFGLNITLGRSKSQKITVICERSLFKKLSLTSIKLALHDKYRKNFVKKIFVLFSERFWVIELFGKSLIANFN